MPECIVCKGYYSSGTVCRRCGSDNAKWLEWRESEPVEKEGLWGLLHFTEPHCHTPFFIVVMALAFGLMGIGGMWEGINLAARLFTVTATVGGCLLIIQTVYAGRHTLRETELLKRWRIARRKARPKVELGVQLKTVLVPVIVVGVILLLFYALVKSEDLWKLAEWLILELEPTSTPTPEPEPIPTPTPKPGPTPTPTPTPTPFVGIRERVKRAIPLILLIGYVGLGLALTYSSSMALGRRYVGRMNQELPHPIFLQDEKLAQVVRREAEVELGRIDPKSPNVIDYAGYIKYDEETDPRILRLAPNVDVLTTAAGSGTSPPRVEVWGQAATWVWDELERTEDGGIKMKVARQEVYQLPKQTEKSGLRPIPRVSYVVHADPWGRITKIERDEKQSSVGKDQTGVSWRIG